MFKTSWRACGFFVCFENKQEIKMASEIYPPLFNLVILGDNIYAVLRAPRASSTEGLVLSTPYRPPDLSFEPSTGQIF